MSNTSDTLIRDQYRVLTTVYQRPRPPAQTSSVFSDLEVHSAILEHGNPGFTSKA